MKATPVLLWTVPFWRATRIACWKAWQLPPTLSVRKKAISTFAPNIRWQSNDYDWRYGRQNGWACSEHASLGQHSAFISRYAWVQGPLSVGKKPPLLPLSRANVAILARALPTLQNTDSGGHPPLSTTSKPSPTSPPFCAMVVTGMLRLAPKKAKAQKSSPGWSRRQYRHYRSPHGYPLREIIFDIGGGIPDGQKFKAVQTGGPSGGCIPESILDMTVDTNRLLRSARLWGLVA